MTIVDDGSAAAVGAIDGREEATGDALAGPRFRCTRPSSKQGRRPRRSTRLWLSVSDRNVSCQFPTPGSYSSAEAIGLVTPLMTFWPPATSTWPPGSNVAV